MSKLSRGIHIDSGFQLCIRKVCFFSAPFRRHINRVVLFCPKEKVIWIYAGRVVAFMKNAKPIRDISIMNTPRESMRRMLSAFSINFMSEKEAVSKGVFLPRPKPTRWSLYDLTKESFFYGSCASFVITGLATLRARLSSIATLFFYFNSAVRTCSDILLVHGKLILSCDIPRTVNAVAGFYYIGGV